eukprot:TRINITY_DN2484_c0_g1_i1.p2 TRINITY_DN2484_c0_g1~~TRINITY_DN2484_c0_g1_i1.p2  ORF type:complete len:119 (+),score=43.61 TRINITY_DN2484_c0_g1_i1:39-395(+)
MGEWKGGLEHGHGIFEHSDGRTFAGEFRNGRRNGKGRLEVPGEGTWEGCWIEDKEVGIFNLVVDGEVVKSVNWDEINRGHGNLDMDEQDKVSNSVISVEKWVEEKSLVQIADNEVDAN